MDYVNLLVVGANAECVLEPMVFHRFFPFPSLLPSSPSPLLPSPVSLLPPPLCSPLFSPPPPLFFSSLLSLLSFSFLVLLLVYLAPPGPSTRASRSFDNTLFSEENRPPSFNRYIFPPPSDSECTHPVGVSRRLLPVWRPHCTTYPHICLPKLIRSAVGTPFSVDRFGNLTLLVVDDFSAVVPVKIFLFPFQVLIVVSTSHAILTILLSLPVSGGSSLLSL